MNIPAAPRVLTPSQSSSTERLGVPFLLLLIWIFFEFGRPPNPLGIPLLISLALFLAWVVRSDKQWSRQGPWWLALLGVMALGVPFAENTYSAFWAARNMAVLILCICLPMQALLTSVRRVRVWILVFLAVALYVGGWAATHHGYGPSASSGGQDENYIAALMGVAISFAYFSLFAAKRLTARIGLAAMILVFIAAIGLANNPSRGGFIGLCAVGLYCLSRSPKKLLGLGVLSVAVAALLVVAGPAFWAEIGTSTDYQSGTGDMRLELWAAGWRMRLAHPFFGVGADNFRWVVGDYQTAAQLAKFGRSLAGSVIPHSFWVEMVAETGALGALATGVITWKTWTGLRKVRDEIRRQGSDSAPEAAELACYADGIRGGILAILVNGLFLSLFYYSHLWLLLALGSAVPFIYGRMNPGAPGTTSAISLPRRRGAGAVGLPVPAGAASARGTGRRP